ncbi:MAG: hypothetical protein Q9162_001945 [Coniocarpon cinnabarinum]
MAFKNSTASVSFFPSTSDLYMAMPRLGSSIAGFFGVNDLSWFSNITGNDTSQIFSSTASLLSWTPPAARPVDDTSSWMPTGLFDGVWLTLSRLSHLDGIFSYLWSKWAITTMLMAILLNRARIFSSVRQPVHLTWKSRLFLRIVPIILLMQQATLILQALRCQTGFQLPQIRFKDSSDIINKSWITGTPTVLLKTVSYLLFWQSTEDSCLAAGMVPPAENSMQWHGSTVFLWPLFIVLGASQLVETVASALQGRAVRSETGMNMFEHSLAFAEAETVARAAVGIGLFGLPRASNDPPNATESDSSSTGKLHTFTRGMLLQKLNVPPEVLLICLISCSSHLSSQLLAVAGLQNRYRLLNTGTWGILFMALFVYSFVSYSHIGAVENVHIIRYPTWRHLSIKEQIRLAHANMSTHSSWTSIRISMGDDFYQFVLRVGYQMLVAAAQAVYFREGLQVTLNPQTWLEKARYDEATKTGHQHTNLVPLELQREFSRGDGFGLTDEPPQTGSDGLPLPSGYARERKTMANLSKSGAAAMTEQGVGISQRGGRWTMSWKLLEQTSELVNYCCARCILAGYGRFAWSKSAPPKWLLQAAKIHQSAQSRTNGNVNDPSQQRTIEFWRLTDGGAFEAAKDGSNVDVEYETRRRFANENSKAQPVSEAKLDGHLYNWWKAGGWWGESDSSGEYKPPLHDDLDDPNFDTTSQATVASTSGWETESASSTGSNKTVIPRRHVASSSVSNADDTLDETFTFHKDIANLLDPKTPQHKQDAKLLAQRLRSPESHNGPMTRSRYQRSVLRETISKLPMQHSPLLSAEDEALMLDHLIQTRRRPQASSSGNGATWQQGGSGMGEGGPHVSAVDGT